jgi:thiamine-phosphate pyrophosphorylase
VSESLRLPRLYPILDTGLLEARGCRLETAAAAMVKAGAGVLQIRHKGHWPRGLFEEAERVAAICAQANVTLVVNDRADIALLLHAGLHVGQDDLPPANARGLIGNGVLLGFSTHNSEQLSAAAMEPVDYVAIGPIFPTQSKMNPDPIVGVARLAELRALTARPLVAIGGITRENCSLALDAGADSVAVISDLLPADCSSVAIHGRFREWRSRMSE